jgi:hypothetical protein
VFLFLVFVFLFLNRIILSCFFIWMLDLDLSFSLFLVDLRVLNNITYWICYFFEMIINIWGIPLIILGILDHSVNFLDDLPSNCITFICTLYPIKFNLTKNGSTLLTSGELRIINLLCTNYPSPKIIPCIFFSKLFWTYFFNCGCSIKSPSNICRPTSIYSPTCLTNPSLTSLSICGHFVMTCPLIL